MTDELGDVLFERVFETLDADGNTREITLRVGIPFQVSESTNTLKWRCPYQLKGIGSERIQKAPGMDAIDAILIGLRIAEIVLKSHKDIKITWLGEDWLGFPFIDPDGIPDHDESQFFEEIFDEFFASFAKKRKPSSLE